MFSAPILIPAGTLSFSFGEFILQWTIQLLTLALFSAGYLLYSEPLRFVLSTKSDSDKSLSCHFLNVKGGCTFRIEINLGNMSMIECTTL